MEQHGCIRRFAVGLVYPNKLLTMCSSGFVFRKYKRDSAFRVSGVLQLTKTGPPVTIKLPTKEYSFAYSSQMLRWLEGFTHNEVSCTNLHILTAHGMLHILTPIGQL